MLDKYGKILVLRNGVLFYKWLKLCSELPWRHDIASLNYILASNVWQQDHNGFTHQDPGFLDHVANKKADVVLTCAASYAYEIRAKSSRHTTRVVCREPFCFCADV